MQKAENHSLFKIGFGVSLLVTVFLIFSIRQNYFKASSIFAEICFKYAEDGWNHIDTVLIERYAICQRQLKQNFNLVSCYLHLVRFPLYLELESHSFYLEQLSLCSVHSVENVTVSNSSLFSLGNIAMCDGLGIGENLDAIVQIENHLPTVII